MKEIIGGGLYLQLGKDLLGTILPVVVSGVSGTASSSGASTVGVLVSAIVLKIFKKSGEKLELP